MLQVEIDFNSIKDFAKASALAPKELVKQTAEAFRRIGAYDIWKFRRTQLTGGAGLNVKSKGLKKAFKFKTNKRAPTDITEIYLDEYVGWKAATIFEKGGSITPKKAKTLTILPPWQRNAQGRRKENIKTIRAKISSGEYKVIKTKTGPMVIKERGGLNKKGTYKKNSRTQIIAFLKRRVTLKKRIDWYGNFDGNAGVHEKYLEKAADKTLMVFTKGKK